MIKIESLETDKLSIFDRLLPKEVHIAPYQMTYIDANDIDEKVRLQDKKFLRESPAYAVLLNEIKSIQRGSKVKSRFCVYAYTGQDLIGRSIFTEYLDNPDGYGGNDFLYTKLVYPKFSGSVYSRRLTSALLHMMLISSIAKNVYAYLRAKPKTGESTFFLDRIDKSQPCVPLIRPTDNQNVQKHVIIKKEFILLRHSTPYILVEYNGDIYRSMDKYEYIHKATGSSNVEGITREIRELDNLANTARKLYE